MESLDTLNILGTMDFDFSSFSWILKVPLAIFIAGIVFYNFMMLLRIRILADTVDSNENSSLKKLASIQTFLSIGGCLVSLVLILLG